MELQKRRFLRGTFDFSPQGIGAAADFVGQGLEALGADHKDALRNRLSVEEVLLNWQRQTGLNAHYTVELARRMGRVLLTLRCGGAPCDPLAPGEAENEALGSEALGRAMLENLGLSLVWQYRGGCNLLSCTQKAGRRHSQLSQVLFAAVLALALGGLGCCCPRAGAARCWIRC